MTGILGARGGEPAIGNAHGAANAKAAFGKIQAVANGAANAIERNPFDEFRGDAALQNKILEQTSNVIVGKGGGDGGAQSETAAQSARDIIFPAAFPNFEFARGADTAFAGVEAKHDFAEGKKIVFAGGLWFQLQGCHSSGCFNGESAQECR
jgi:hypothetical protein